MHVAVQDKEIIFSILIPTCFRSLEAVEKCLKSLSEQTIARHQFEVFLIDDGSDQCHRSKMEEWLNKYFDHAYYLWKEKGGQGPARNFAMKQAKGKLLLFLNDDAIADPTLLADHIALHEQHPDNEAACLGKFTVSKELPYSMFASLHSEYAYSPFEGHEEIDWRGFYTCNISVKKAFLDEFGYFDEQLRYYEDVELGERLSHHGLRIFYRPDIMAYHYHYLDEKNFLGYAPFHSKALVDWYKKSPHLKEALIPYGFFPAESNLRRFKYRLEDLIVNRFTMPLWLNLARFYTKRHAGLALSLYKKIFLSLSRKTIRDELRQT